MSDLLVCDRLSFDRERSIRRVALRYTLWMVQRMLDASRGMPANDAETVRNWLEFIGGEGFLSLDIPRLRRVGLHAAIDRTAKS